VLHYQSEFPALYAVTKMYPEVLKLVGENLTNYSSDVRIDYGRWIQFEKEYGDWANTVIKSAQDDYNNFVSTESS
jgi:hypothetical protein